MDSREQTIQRLEARLAVMERSLQSAQREIVALQRTGHAALVRRHATLVVAAIAIAFAFSRSTGMAQANAFPAPFRVVDEAGSTLMEVKKGQDGGAVWNLFRDGARVVQASGTSTGGVLFVANMEERPVFGAASDGRGNGELVLWSSDGNRMLDAMQGKNGGNGIGMYSGGEVKAEVFARGDEGTATVKGHVFVETSAGEAIARLGLYSADFESLGQAPKIEGGPLEGEAAKAGLYGLDTSEHEQAKDGLVVFGKGRKPVVQAFANSSGNGSLSVLHASDRNLSALLGVAAAGPALTMNAAGVQQAALAVLGGKATLELKNSAAVGIVQIAEGPGGAGRLELGNPNGDTVVEAGTLQNGNGLVRVYPWRATTPGMLLGMPGTYIVGHRMGGGQ